VAHRQGGVGDFCFVRFERLGDGRVPFAQQYAVVVAVQQMIDKPFAVEIRQKRRARRFVQSPRVRRAVVRARRTVRLGHAHVVQIVQSRESLGDQLPERIVVAGGERVVRHVHRPQELEALHVEYLADVRYPVVVGRERLQPRVPVQVSQLGNPVAGHVQMSQRREPVEVFDVRQSVQRQVQAFQLDEPVQVFDFTYPVVRQPQRSQARDHAQAHDVQYV